MLPNQNKVNWTQEWNVSKYNSSYWKTIEQKKNFLKFYVTDIVDKEDILILVHAIKINEFTKSYQ